MIVLLALLILFAGCSHDSGVSSEKEPLAIIESSGTFFEISSSSVVKHLVSSAMESSFSSSQDVSSNSQPIVSSSSQILYSSGSNKPLSSESKPPLDFSFYTGADISTVQEYERFGAKFYDVDGTETDIFSLLKKHGFNAIRLRTFVSPAAQYGYAATGCDHDKADEILNQTNNGL